MNPRIGVLLTNTGTPDAPDARAVRRYLREFLSDRRIVKIPRLLWLPLLNLVILPLRSRKSSTLYQTIWTDEGAPMRVSMQNLRELLQDQLHTAHADISVEIGMNYGNPSIVSALEKLRGRNIDKLIVVPLFPQYSNSTTASSFDRITKLLRKWTSLPALKLIRDYAEHPQYIDALTQSVTAFWRDHGETEHLLISFHGLPQRFVDAGDPYPQHCEATARLLAESLRLNEDRWTLCYQSQFGYDKWLKPSTQNLLTGLPAKGIQQADIICPGFSMDCLETLEEIAVRGKASFIAAGGKNLRLIPSLNDSITHAEFLKNIILPEGVHKQSQIGQL